MASKRITLLAEMAKDASRVADIGCDHGYTLLEIFKINPNIVKAYALDINEGPLNQARSTFSTTSYLDKVEFHLSNGLLDFNESFDTAIISGMGGSLITEILSNSIDKFRGKTLILEPQGNINMVRRWLYCNGFDITDEYDLLENNKYYNFICAKEKSDVKYNILDINYGPILRRKRTSEFLNYYKKIYDNFNNIKNKPLEIKEKLIELDYILNNKDITQKCLYNELLVNNSNDYVVIFPGGAYKFTSEREGDVVGLHFNAMGYNALIINYLSEGLKLNDMYMSVSNCLKEYFKDKIKARIYLVGFSAGAHFVLELSNHKNLYNIRANGIILGYPLVSTKDEITHFDSLEFIKMGLDNENIKRYSEELEVNDSSLPMYVFTTLDDKIVNVKNTFRLCEAYSKLDISYECHILGKGEHGFSLATKETARTPSDINSSLSRWFKNAIEWMNRKEN